MTDIEDIREILEIRHDCNNNCGLDLDYDSDSDDDTPNITCREIMENRDSLMNNIILNHNLLEHDPDGYFYEYKNDAIKLSRARFVDSGTWKIRIIMDKVPDYISKKLHIDIDYWIGDSMSKQIRTLYKKERNFNRRMPEFRHLQGNPIYELLKFSDLDADIRMIASNNNTFYFSIYDGQVGIVLSLRMIDPPCNENGEADFEYLIPIDETTDWEKQILRGMSNHEFDELTFFEEFGLRNPLILRGNTTKSANKI